MLLRDLFINWLIETDLFEMAFERKKAIQIVEGHAKEIANHFVKVLTFADKGLQQHWLTELNNFLNDIDDVYVKPNNKRLKPLEYKKYLWEGWLGHGALAIQQIQKHLLRQYLNVERSDLTPYQIAEILEKAYHNISYDLANNKYAGDVMNYINMVQNG